MEKARLASVAALPPLPKHSLCFLYLQPTVGRCLAPNIYRMWKILHVFCSKYIACIKYSITYGPRLALLSCSHYYKWNQLSFVSLCKYSWQLYFKFKLMNIYLKTDIDQSRPRPSLFLAAGAIAFCQQSFVRLCRSLFCRLSDSEIVFREIVSQTPLADWVIVR